MLFSISYVLLGLVAVLHAIPVDFRSGQTAPSHPHAVSLLDPRLEPQPLKDKIFIDFPFGEFTKRKSGCSNPMIEKEINLIFKAYRRSINAGNPFELVFRDDYHGNIDDNRHDFVFWGEGVGGDCQTSRDPCSVEYEKPSSTRDPKTHLATILAEDLAAVDTPELFRVTYAIRNHVLSEESVSNELLLCKVM
ncbi:hypothetical protein DFJ43DRAFT_154713 [Lentinula guzmanii]|uniref:Uncharacterized protein n=1 Tax=Lentinula guzmanii TaxID=2804957 RepID=A0AA38N2V5_9AGAR|nr:hypothetical protein DFJ43DRAFT_154713 [Lentinula guzmanii]